MLVWGCLDDREVFDDDDGLPAQRFAVEGAEAIEIGPEDQEADDWAGHAGTSPKGAMSELNYAVGRGALDSARPWAMALSRNLRPYF